MQLKCNFCDITVTKKMKEQGIKPIKSINTESDEYVKDEKNKYYHVECYVQHLMKRKKMNEGDAREKLKIQLDLIKLELNELKEKDQFYQWIKEYYDCSLPGYFCMKIAEVVSGKHERVKESIPYNVLLDIYQKMATYLNKNAANKNFKCGQRMNYDLAVVLGNYGDYKNYKEKQKYELERKKNASETIIEQKKIDSVLKRKDEQDKSFTLSDVLDDILL